MKLNYIFNFVRFRNNITCQVMTIEYKTAYRWRQSYIFSTYNFFKIAFKSLAFSKLWGMVKQNSLSTVPLLWGGFWVRSRRMLIWCTAPNGSKSSFSSVSDQERGICPTNILMESGSGWSKCSRDPFILLPLLRERKQQKTFVISKHGLKHRICIKTKMYQ